MSLSTKTHRFQRGQAPSDGACLFWSFLMATTSYWKKIFGFIPRNLAVWSALVDGLRIGVVDYIRCHTEIHPQVLASQSVYKNVGDYCTAIVKGDLWPGDIELKVLSTLHDIGIVLIDPTKIDINNHLVPSFYGQDNPSAKYCIFIYFNGIDHFDPLVMKIEGTNQFQTMFRCYEPMAIFLLWKYIKELKREHNQKNIVREIERKGKLLSSTVSMKRKTSDIDNVVAPPNDAKLMPILIEHNYYNMNKRIKTNVESQDENIEKYKYNSRATSNMNGLIQADEEEPVITISTSEMKCDDETDSDSDTFKTVT